MENYQLLVSKARKVVILKKLLERDIPFFLKHGCRDCGHYTLKINSQQLKCNENTQILKKP